MTLPGTRPGLVSVEWLAAHLGAPELTVLDASWYLPATGRDARAEFLAGHIPGAIFCDIDRLSDSRSPLPHMLPEPEEFTRRVRELGVRADATVVAYDGSGINLSAPRVWWMLRVMGHQQVAVLDGGLKRWKSEGLPLERGDVTPEPGDFTARLDRRQVRTLDEVRQVVETGGAQLVDMRSAGRFRGTEPEPRPGLRGGHIPSSRNLPFNELVTRGGLLLSDDELRARLQEAGVDPGRPVVASCGSGVTACALLHALHVLGSDGHALYDGSWSEWGAEGQSTPVER